MALEAIASTDVTESSLDEVSEILASSSRPVTICFNGTAECMVSQHLVTSHRTRSNPYVGQVLYLLHECFARADADASGRLDPEELSVPVDAGDACDVL